ncbi:MAG TPA: 2OG-Fe(II) oxygenase family protein [Steroidobacteraceae bacterium]|jgi:isopenicillin N synthase-like dioxygenase|nr:2OG-Fe(II) oxygenase family protein [Steroidobacteraceae bacterium]
MPTQASIPVVDIAALFAGPSAMRDGADLAIMRAAEHTGFFVARGLPEDIRIDAAARAELLRVFQLPSSETRKLWRRKFDPAHPNVYRGWFPLQTGHLTSKEGIDLGPDVAYGPAVLRSGDPLCEATPLPAPEALPGWRQSITAYYLAMERASAALMRSIARSLHLPSGYFDDFFKHGLSTLRLIRYPVRSDLREAEQRHADFWVTSHGGRAYIMGTPHVDSGFLTLLAQDEIGGLQAHHLNGHWIDVPPIEGTLAVNFGKVLERWCNGRIMATEHRVIGSGRERMSIPFFYEARVDAKIEPLPLNDADSFEPFLYGDHLWSTTTQFVEFQGMEGLRMPRGLPH